MLVSVFFLPTTKQTNWTATVDKISQTLKENKYTYEIVIAEDGSTDGTAELSEELTQKYPFVRHIHREKRLGRGTALNNAFKQSSGEVLVYMDLDLPQT